MISQHLPNLPETAVTGYLERYHEVRFEEKEVTKRQYSKWLVHLAVILHTLDQDVVPDIELTTHVSEDPVLVEMGKKKKKKKRGK